MSRENDEELTNEIKKLALKLGADKVGIANANLATNPPHGHANPINILTPPESAIVYLIKIPDAACNSQHSDELIHDGVMFTAQQEINHELFRIGLKITSFLEKIGYDATPVSSDIPRDETKNMWNGVLSMRYLAQLAGLGEIGLSNLILTPEWGPRVQIGCVITDAVLKQDGPVLVDKVCTKCKKCIEACPPLALKADNYPPFNFNLNRCLWATQGWFRLTKVEEPPQDWVEAKPTAMVVVEKYNEKYPQIQVNQEWVKRLGDLACCQECMVKCTVGVKAHKKRTEGE